MELELEENLKEEIKGLIVTMDTENQTEQDISGGIGLTLLREDSDGLNKRKERPGGVIKVLEYKGKKYYLCSF